MAYFFVIAHDKPEKSSLVRGTVRGEHLEYWGHYSHMIVTGGPLLSEENSAKGSAFIMQADDQATIEEVFADDPYTKAGLFDRVEVLWWKPSLGDAIS